MKQIIYILGTTASGKTTQGKRLAKMLDAKFIEADKVYDSLGAVYKRKDYDHLTKPEEWAKYPDFEEQRLKWWKKQFEGLSGTVVIEGATLIYKEELAAIRNCTGGHTEIFLYLKPSNWEELYKKKHKSGVYAKPFKDYEEKVKEFKSKSGNKVVTITNLEEMVKPLGYQRDGFTDKKWASFEIDSLKKKSVLDLGCNSGWFSEYVFQLGASQYLGVDNQWKEIAYARALQRGVFDLMDLETFLKYSVKWEDGYDVTIMASTLHYFKEKELIIERIASITKDYFILEIPIQKDSHDLAEYYIEKNDYYIPTKELVLYWLGKHFNKVEVIGQSPPPDGSHRLVFKAYK